MAFLTERRRLCRRAARQLRIQLPALPDDAPIWRLVGGTLLRGFGGDADEDAGAERASGVSAELTREFLPQFARRHGASKRDAADRCVDVPRRRDEHRSRAALPLHRGWDGDDLAVLGDLKFFAPGFAGLHLGI